MGLGDIVRTIARGKYGDDWIKAAGQQQEIANAKQRMELLNSADTRAAAGEARIQEESDYNKTRRGTSEAMDAEKLAQAQRAGRLGQAEEDYTTASGGGAGKFTRETEDRARKMKMEDAQLRIAQATTAIARARDAREQMQAVEELRRAKSDANVAEQTVGSRVEAAKQAVDPAVRDSQILNSLTQMVKDPNLPDEDRQAYREMYNQILTRLNTRRTAGGDRNGAIMRPAAPPGFWEKLTGE